jgi:hypothetical protein
LNFQHHSWLPGDFLNAATSLLKRVSVSIFRKASLNLKFYFHQPQQDSKKNGKTIGACTEVLIGFYRPSKTILSHDTIPLKYNVFVLQAGGHGIDLIQNGHPHGPPFHQPAAWNSRLSKDDKNVVCERRILGTFRRRIL